LSYDIKCTRPIGDYSVVDQNENKNKEVAGELPSELGNLRNWKYVVFSK